MEADTPDQPAILFFEISMGNLHEIYKYPEVPIKFQATFESVPSFVFTLFDISGEDVEPAIWNSLDPGTNISGGTLRFGYLNGGKQSGNIGFEIESYRRCFENNAYAITIYATSKLTSMLSSNQMSGTIQEILEKMTENHSMDLKIIPEFGAEHMMEVGANDSKSTAKREMRHMKWSDETDISYIERILEYARDGEGKGGYRYFISSDEDGKPMLTITKAKNGSANWEFKVQSKDTTVIRWEPDVSFSAGAFGTNDIQMNCVQSITGDEQKIVCQQQNTKQFQETFGKENSTNVKSLPTKEKADRLIYCGGSENFPESVTGSAMRVRPGASASPYAGVNPTLNSHLYEWMDSMDAELTLLGDPEIVPIDGNGNITLVDVTCYSPKNYRTKYDGTTLDYSSGLYQCLKVVQNIDSGSFTTTLFLTRACNDKPEVAEE
jgi:hypothetical protein